MDSWADLKLGEPWNEGDVTAQEPDGLHGDYEGDRFPAFEPDDGSAGHLQPLGQLLLGQASLFPGVTDSAA